MPLRLEEHSGTAGSRIAKDMLRIIQFSSQEPLIPWHGSFHQHGRVRLRSLNVKVVPEGSPEVFQMADRPFPEFLVGLEGQPLFPCKPLYVLRDIGLLLYLL